MSATTILLYGRTNSGKSSQIGVLAEDVYKRTGKKTRVYTCDRGGIDPIRPYVTLGIIQAEEYLDGNPWVWLNQTVKGRLKRDGKWLLDKKANDEVGLYAFESAHGIAKLLKLDMERKAGEGINIGGDTNTSFDAGGEGVTLKIGTTKGFQKFSIPQSRIQEEMMESQRLPAEFVLWTAGTSKDDDETSMSGVVGPDVIGRALTSVLPMDYNYTIRIDVLPAQEGKDERHIMYLGNHVDSYRISNPTIPGSSITRSAHTMGNIRRPLDAPPLKVLTIEPADIVKALRLVRDEAQVAAVEKIKQRLALK